MKALIKNKDLVITLPLEKPTPSASGKTLVVAGTRGFKRTGLAIEGKEVWLNANAVLYHKDRKKARKPEKQRATKPATDSDH
jgi:hypothetical protein